MSYAQRNYPQVKLGDGSCGETIASAGCYVTTWADILTWSGYPIDPPSLNYWLNKEGLFVDGCLLTDDVLNRLGPTHWGGPKVSTFAGPADLSLLDTSTPNVYVVAMLRWPNGLSTDEPHFVPIYDGKRLLICDSYDGQIKSLSAYGDPKTIVTKIIRQPFISTTPPAVTIKPPDPARPPSGPTAPPSQGATPAPPQPVAVPPVVITQPPDASGGHADEPLPSFGGHPSPDPHGPPVILRPPDPTPVNDVGWLLGIVRAVLALLFGRRV